MRFAKHMKGLHAAAFTFATLLAVRTEAQPTAPDSPAPEAPPQDAPAAETPPDEADEAPKAPEKSAPPGDAPEAPPTDAPEAAEAPKPASGEPSAPEAATAPGTDAEDDDTQTEAEAAPLESQGTVAEDAGAADTQEATATEDDEGQPEAAPVGEHGEAEEFLDLSLEELLSVQIVEAASRRKQTLHDAQAAVSVVDREAIEQTGAVHAAELLRRVPGAHVVRMANNYYGVHLRNQSTYNGNRTLVLLNGRPVFDPVFGFSPWGALNLSPMQLERVEVVRGPGSTLYGAGAAGGVIRLTTRRPLDHQGFEGDVNAGLAYLPDGDGPSEPTSLNNAAYGHVAYNWANDAKTFGVRGAVRFGLAPEADTVVVEDPFHGQSSYRVNLDFDFRPDADTTAFFSLSHMDQEAVANSSATEQLYATTERAVTFTYERKNLFEDHLTTSIVTDFTRLESVDQGAGSSSRYHALWLNDLTFFDGRSTTTIGGEVTVTNGNAGISKPNTLAYSLVAQQDVALLDNRALILSGASRFETIRYEDGLGGEIDYRTASPRISVVGKIREDHDLRLTAASAYRIPTALEVASGSSEVAGAPDEPLQRTLVPNDALEAEHTDSLELGYRGDYFKRLRLELVGYLQRVQDVVVPDITGSLPFVFVNAADDANQIGTEVDVRVAANERTSVYTHFTARRTQSDDSTLRNAWPDYILGLGTDNTLNHGVRLHADASFVVGYGSTAIDNLPGTPLLVSTVRDVSNQIDLNLRLGKLLLDGKAEVYLLARNLLGFVRDRDDLTQFRAGVASHPVGATVLVGVSLFEN